MWNGVNSDRKQENTARVTQDGILRGLEELGIRRGEILYVHSSLSAFGHVDGGADSVIDALLESVGPGGAVAVPTFTWERNHAKPVVVFDVANDSSEVGYITEMFRQRPEALRNEHVCHSTAAIGPAAEAIMGDSIHPFAFDASLYKCYELDSWYVFLGCGFSSGTALHTVEEIMQAPYRYYRDFKGSTVIRPDGTRVPALSVEFLRRAGYANDFAKMDTVFETDGILRHTCVGNATLTAARIRDVIDGGIRYLKDDICFLLDEPSRTRWGANHQGDE
ncbi:MAG: AAC(3) family N-acetyltransferase [Candidatus Hydrogenedentes bacterium]|nr:AAC(3) family N-acetyltransferase [Candidatus Hydrogenedentota bacterium]